MPVRDDGRLYRHRNMTGALMLDAERDAPTPDAPAHVCNCETCNERRHRIVRK